MEKLLNAVYNAKQPKFFPVPEYIGKSFEKITNEHPKFKGIPYCWKGEESLILEIRLENSTLSCIIKDEICTEAYKFPD